MIGGGKSALNTVSYIVDKLEIMQKPNEQQSNTEAKTAEKSKQRIAGRYEVVSRLVGGMGIVYLCRDHVTDLPVALKTFKPQYLSHREARDLFLREGTMWVEIGSHPNVVHAFRIERLGDGREVYLVLEWIVQPAGRANPSLRSWLYPSKPLPVAQSLLFGLHMVRGMKHATKRIPGLIHRDLKPENILVGYDHVARITDFGLASTLSGMITQQGALSNIREEITAKAAAGTPTYMAPEQWNNDILDPRADIYAFGCILYEMLTGYFAAEGNNREELQDLHMSGMVATRKDLLPDAALPFLKKCLFIDREKRFRNWTAVEYELNRLYWSLTGEEPPPEHVVDYDEKAEKLALGRSYMTMGMSYLDIGKLDLAVMYFEQAIGIGRAEGAIDLECESLGNLAFAYLMLGYYERAREFLREHFAMAQRTNNRAEEARALGNLGRAYRRTGFPKKALNYHGKQLAIVRSLQDGYKEAEALSSLGDTYHQLGQSEKAVALFKQSLTIARDVGDQVRVRSILGSMGRIYLEADDPNEALALFSQAAELARRIGDHVGEGESIGGLGDLQAKIGNSEKAIELYLRALDIFEDVSDLRRQIYYLNSLGDLYLQLGDVEEAREYHEAALIASKEMGNRFGESYALNKLGNVYCALGDYFQGAKFYKEALRLAELSNAYDLQKTAILGLGYAYASWGDLDRTTGYYQQYLTLVRAHEDRAAECDVLQRLGDVYYRTKQPRLSKQAYESCLALLSTKTERTKTGYVYSKLARTVIDLGETKEGVDLAKKALAIGQKVNDEALQATALGDLSLAYSASGKNWQAGRTGDKAIKLAKKVGNDDVIAWTSYKIALILYRQGKMDKVLPLAEQAVDLFTSLGDRDMVERSQRMVTRLM